MLPFRVVEKIFPHGNGGWFLYGTGLPFISSLDLLKEEGSPDGLSDVCHLVVDGCVFLVALMSFLHLFYAYKADV